MLVPVTNLFHPYMDMIYTLYGAAFMSMGLVARVKRNHDSQLTLSRKLWLLAGFGLCHGFMEWLSHWDMWRVGPWMVIAESCLLLASLLFLFEFGRRLVLASLPASARSGLAGALLAPWIYLPMSLVALAGTIPRDDPMQALQVWIQYLLEFPGATLTGVGFILYFRARMTTIMTATDLKSLKIPSYAAGIGFIAYGLFGVLAVPRTNWFPASWLNEDRFMAALYVPVQVLQAICAMLIAAAVSRLLEVFRLERVGHLRLSLAESEDTLGSLRHLHLQNQLILSSTVEGIVNTDPDGIVTFVNDAALAMLGFSREELVGQNFHEMTHHTKPDGTPYPVEECPIHETMYTHTTCRVAEAVFWRRDGSAFPVYYAAAPMLHDGRVKGVVITFDDRTEDDKANMSLRQAKQEADLSSFQVGSLAKLLRLTLADTPTKDYLLASLHVLLDHVPCVSLLPKGAIFLTVDSGQGEHLEMVAQRELSTPLLTLCARVEFGQCLCGRAAQEKTTQFASCIDHRHDIHFDGIAPHGHYNVPIMKQGKVLGVIVFYLPHNYVEHGRERDFLEKVAEVLSLGISRRADRDALRAAKVEAEAAARAKGEFLANMSHEIRTPINAVLGFADLCLRIDLPPRGRDYVEKIHIAANSLLGVINNILDFSKIESGKLEIESIPFSLSELLHRLSALFNHRARKKGVELVVGAPPSVPDDLLGDPLRLGQVLINLLENALKFTERGEILLTVESDAAQDNMVTLRFLVSDTGPGLTAQQQARLFTAFSQADSSITRKHGGTGLGLAICKQLVECMGGEIRVESEVGAGSRFSFSVRVGVPAPKALPVSPPSIHAGKRVLVVEDNDDMRALLCKYVAFLGCRHEAVSSGEAALEHIQAGVDFDLILLDWHMPGMGGLEAARRISAAGLLIPIIMNTGDEPELARTLVDNGEIQAFLSKPVSIAILRETLCNVLSGKDMLAPQAPAQDQVPTLVGKRILLVDDNDFNRQVGRELVELTGATVVTANDGVEAVAAATVANFDLILMDLQMPVMDGYTATQTIRQSQPDLPILALTAHAIVGEKARVLAAGMNDILTKPIWPATLHTMLQYWLLGGAQVEASTFVPAALLPAPTENPPEVADDGFDLEAGLARVNGDRKMLDRFLRLFRDRNLGCVAEIGAAMQQQDTTTARRLAHTLKGSAGTIGALQLQTAAARLEALLESEEHAGDRTESLTALESVWVRTLTTLGVLLDAPASPSA